MNKEIKKEEVVEEVEVKTEETKQPEVVETKEKIPAKIKVGNFVRKHRVAIVSIATGAAGAVAGFVLGVKVGENKSGTGDTAALTDVTDTTIPEIPSVDIPSDVN